LTRAKKEQPTYLTDWAGRGDKEPVAISNQRSRAVSAAAAAVPSKAARRGHRVDARTLPPARGRGRVLMQAWSCLSLLVGFGRT